ncbi:MAG: chemotaxis-specific protein-glutamate methyltransferase CheB [Polyangiaceae bacterium]
MSKTRVLVVEDSLTVRQRLIGVLRADPDVEVIGEAADGKSAIELCQSLRPDVVTLDMVLPVMTGLAATEYIMAYCPTPILIVSASLNRGELFHTYDALAAGALEVLEKPRGDEIDGVWEAKFLSLVKLVARIKVITHPRARLSSSRSDSVRVLPPAAGRHDIPCCVALGASTGGPAAVATILRALPRDFPLPILLVIHIGSAFAASLAEWLDAQSGINVAYAVHGESLPPIGRARVLMAPPERHLVVRRGHLELTRDPERWSCRPSVDVLFESLAPELGAGVIGCLLTGMGRDGAAGLAALRRAGATTVAQDEASSVVYGMPREAVLLGGASHVLSLDKIGPALCELAKPSKGH